MASSLGRRARSHERGRHAAARRTDVVEYIAFLLGSTQYALPVASIREIDPSQGTQRFTEAFRASDGSEPDSLVSSVYDGVLVLSDAVSRMVVEPTRDALRDALAATRDIEGATGRFGIDTNRNADKAVVMVQIVRGRPIWRATISPGNPTPVAARG